MTRKQTPNPGCEMPVVKQPVSQNNRLNAQRRITGKKVIAGQRRGFQNKNNANLRQKINGVVGTYTYDPDNTNGAIFAKIPLSCRKVPRAANYFRTFQKYRVHNLLFKVASAWGAMAGGSLRYGVVMDPTDEIDNYDAAKKALASSSVSGIKKVPASYEIEIGANLFKDQKFTSPAENPRFSEYGFLVFIIDASPSDAGSISIDVEADISFSIPSLESEAIAFNGYTPCSLQTIDGQSGLFLGDLISMNAPTAEDVKRVWPGLPDGTCIFKIEGALGAFSQQVGTGNSETVTFDLVIYEPTASDGQYFMPVVGDNKGGFVYSVLTNLSDHGAKGWHYQIAIPSKVSYRVVARSMEDLNKESNGNPITRKWTKNGLVTTQETEATTQLPSGSHSKGGNLSSVKATERGPLPPVTPTVNVNQEQLDSVQDNVNANVDDQHKQTRSQIEAPIGDLNGGVAELNALITSEAVATRTLMREKHVVTISELTASTATIMGEVGACVAYTKQNKSLGEDNLSKNNTIIQKQEEQKTISENQFGTVNTSLANIFNHLGVVVDDIDGVSIKMDENQNSIDNAHGAILAAIQKIPTFNSYELVRRDLESAQAAYGVDTTAFVIFLNRVLLGFQLPQVQNITYDLSLPVGDLVTYMYTGRLFAINGSSDVPMENQSDYAWPSFGNIQSGTEILGLYFRTQYATSVPDFDVYTYFRIVTADNGVLNCTVHKAGDPALPRP